GDNQGLTRVCQWFCDVANQAACPRLGISTSAISRPAIAEPAANRIVTSTSSARLRARRGARRTSRRFNSASKKRQKTTLASSEIVVSSVSPRIISSCTTHQALRGIRIPARNTARQEGGDFGGERRAFIAA